MLFPLISTRIHGLLDYVYAIALIAVLWICDFSIYTDAPWVMLVAEICIVIFSLLTRYEKGYVRVIPMRIHLWLDILVGILLITTPYMLDFERNAKLPYAVMGGLIILLALLTKPAVSSTSAYGSAFKKSRK
ncbi:MAG: SPW repeat domain-containing protein [Chitinophagaceae bacterium]